MAVTLPTSADVRKARERANKIVNNDLVRTPVLAWIGVGDLAVHTLRELPERLRGDELRRRAEDTYDQWVRRGEDTVERVRKQPRVARALRTLEDADARLEQRVGDLVDGLHDSGEEALGRFSSQTRSVGEKTARRAQKVSQEAAAEVTELSADAAEAVQEAGDAAAHEARSVSRKAASRAEPAKSTNNNVRRSASTTRSNSGTSK
jgi:heparin binding hemagglutinin HbhA